MFTSSNLQTSTATTMPIHVKNEPGAVAYSNPYLSSGSSTGSNFNQPAGYGYGGFGVAPVNVPRPAHSNQPPRVPPQGLPNGVSSSQPSQPIVPSGGNTIPPTKPSEPEPDPPDIASIRGLFGWATVDEVSVPYLLREDKKFVAVRIVEMKLLARFPNTFPEELGDHEPLVSYYVTKNETKLLDEINTIHCNYDYGQQPFTPKDLIVKLSEFEDFYNLVKKTFPEEVLEARKTGIPLPPPAELAACRSGWLQVNNTVSPYLRRGSNKYLILPIMKHAAGLLKEVQVESVCPTDEECGLINDMCKEAGLAFQFGRQTKLVSLEDVKSHHKISLMELPTDSPMKYAQYHSDAQKKKATEEEAKQSQQTDNNAVHQQQAVPQGLQQQPHMQPQLPQQFTGQNLAQRMPTVVHRSNVPSVDQPNVAPVLSGQQNGDHLPLYRSNPPPYPGTSAQARYPGYQANMTRQTVNEPRQVHHQTDSTQTINRLPLAGQLNTGNGPSLQTIQQYYQRFMSSQQIRGPNPPSLPYNSNNSTSNSLLHNFQQNPVTTSATPTTAGLLTAGAPQRMSMVSVPNVQGYPSQMTMMANPQHQFLSNAMPATMANMGVGMRNQLVGSQPQQIIRMHPGFPGVNPNIMMNSMPGPNNILQRPPFPANQTHLQSMQRMTSSIGPAAVSQNSAIPQRPVLSTSTLVTSSSTDHPMLPHSVMQHKSVPAAQNTNSQIQSVYAGTRGPHTGQTVNPPTIHQGMLNAHLRGSLTNVARETTPRQTSYSQQVPPGTIRSTMSTASTQSTGSMSQNISAGSVSQISSAGSMSQNSSAGSMSQNISAGSMSQNSSAGSMSQNISAGSMSQNSSAGSMSHNISAASINKTNVQMLQNRNYSFSKPTASQQSPTVPSSSNNTVPASTNVPSAAPVASATLREPEITSSSTSSTVSTSVYVPPVAQATLPTVSPCTPAPVLSIPIPVASPAAKPDLVAAALPQSASNTNPSSVAEVATEALEVVKISKCVSGVRFEGKSISCLEYSNLQGKHALVEAVCKLYFPTCDINEFLFVLEQVLRVPTKACQPNEEKAFIHYYTLPVPVLKCNKMVKLEDLSKYYPQLSYMFSKSKSSGEKDSNIANLAESQKTPSSTNDDYAIQVNDDDSSTDASNQPDNDQSNDQNSPDKEASDDDNIIFLEKTRNPKLGEKLTADVALAGAIQSPQKLSGDAGPVSNVTSFVAIPMFNVPPMDNSTNLRPSGAAKRKHYSGSGLPQKQPKRLEDAVERLKHVQNSEGTSSEVDSGQQPEANSTAVASTSSACDPTVIVLD